MKVRLDKSASMKTAHTIASKLAHGEGNGLPTALVFVRALAMIHQGHHWLTHGEAYYADHLLFERLYNETAEEADQIAEKAVGIGCPQNKLHPGLQASLIAKTVHMFCGDGLAQQEINPQVFMESSLKAEEHFIASLAAIAAEMKEHGELTRGTDNLLAGIEDKHESHVYLLKQRLTSDPWKV
jgi:DNA-binding ferritin-like protein